MVRFMWMSACAVVLAANCPDDPELDLCDGSNDTDKESDFATRQMSVPTMALALAVANSLGGSGVGGVAGPLLMSAMLVPARAASAEAKTSGGSCQDLKKQYKESNCCGADSPETVETGHVLVPHRTLGSKLGFGQNPCKGKKPSDTDFGGIFANYDCVNRALEQSGADVSKNPADRMTPEIEVTDYDAIKNPYWMGVNKGNFSNGPLCPVNVHWHLGAEHRSKGQYDESGKSPDVNGHSNAKAAPTRRLRNSTESEADSRRLANDRYGFACNHYDASLPGFSKPYKWKHCVDMVVGATYEVHWPHSILGMCHTPWQYQTPFYDGVFCQFSAAAHMGCVGNKDCLSNAVGVQGQVFTIINDEDYYFPNLFHGMIHIPGTNYGTDVAYYTGSSTGTSRNNEICSPYSPITWQVDRKCHLISASSFDRLCADMKQQPDDMTSDLHAHGARVLVAGKWTANNQGDAAGGR